jgi:hypothetical protein
MEQIGTLSFSKFRNGEHFQFMSDVKDGITAATPAALNLDSVYPSFESAYTSLDNVLRVDAGSVKTEQLVDADGDRDNTWSALNLRVKATLLSPIEKEVEAAKLIKRVFDLYGNVRQESYNEETALLTNLVDDLEKEENAAYCATMGITKWVTALKTKNNDFKTLLNERNKEYANKESGDVKAARTVIDPIYFEIVKRLNALVTLEMASAEAQEFIKELNQRIKYYETTIDSRAGKNNSGEEDEAPTTEED